MKAEPVTYTAEQIFSQAKAVRLAAKLTGQELPGYLKGHWNTWSCPNLNRITNRDVALFLPYLPDLRCRNLREVVKTVAVKHFERARLNFQPTFSHHAGWRSHIPDAVKDRVAQAIWERKGRPVICDGVTGAAWGLGVGTKVGCRAYLSPTGRLFAAFEPSLSLVSWKEYMKFKPEGTEVGL